MNKPTDKVLSEDILANVEYNGLKYLKSTFKMSPWLIVLQISKAQCAFQFIQK